MLLQFDLSEKIFPSNITNLITDSDELMLSKIRPKQATAQQAMVARHAKNNDLSSYQESGVVKLQLPERFRKLSRKHFVICPVKSGPHHGSFQLLCEFGELNRRYPASKLKPIPSIVWLNYFFPVSSQKVSISEVAD